MRTKVPIIASVLAGILLSANAEVLWKPCADHLFSEALHGWAAPDLAALKLDCGGSEIVLDGSLTRYRHKDDKDTLVINWPYVERSQLDKAGNRSLPARTSFFLADR